MSRWGAADTATFDDPILCAAVEQADGFSSSDPWWDVVRRTIPAQGGTMALSSTVYNFDIVLSDIDRGVYDTLDLKVAQHPSESAEYLVARMLAFCLEACEGIAFPPGGLSNTETPAVWVHDLTGQLQVWIDVGLPSPERLHKASKAATRVAVYCHKDMHAWLRTLAAARVHSSASIELYALDPSVVGAIAASLDRRNSWSLSRMEGVVYLESGDESWELPIQRVAWPS